jgi:DNA modification methylase
MGQVHTGSNYSLYHGDCLNVMAELPDNSIDTVVTDPPYGLNFMSKHWDHGVPGVACCQAGGDAARVWRHSHLSPADVCD